MTPTPLTLPAPIPAKVKPASSPAERMKRIEDRWLWPQLFSEHSRK